MLSEPLKVVLVGCGGMSNAWLDVAVKHSDLSVVGLVDLNKAAAEAMAKKHELQQVSVFTSLTEALKATQPDMVFDVTVPAAHDAITIEALEAGCHVLGEKPMTTSLDKAAAMIVAAHKADRLYAVIQNRRYEPNIQRVVQTLRSGAIGDVQELHCDFFLGPRFGGFRDEMDFPLILDMAIHTFDAARLITGADATNVYCHSFNPKRSWYKGDASAVALFQMTGDIVYSYRGSWCAEGMNTSWCSQWRVIGSKGTLVWNGDTDIEAQCIVPGSIDGMSRQMRQMQAVTIPGVTVPHLAHAGLIHEFVDCIRTGKRPQTICTDNVKSLAMVLAAVQSGQTGQAVAVEAELTTSR